VSVYKDPFKNVLWSSWISDVRIETKHKSEFSILRNLFGYLEANLPSPPFGKRTHYGDCAWKKMVISLKRSRDLKPQN
jgi:hypothetical protein